jgi:hypothetical protein
MSEKARRCPECGGPYRVLDARRLLRECRRCGIKVSGKPGDEEADEVDRS